MSLATILRSTPPAGGLEVSVSDEGRTTIIVLRGEADIATVPIVVQAFADVVSDRDGDVVVDLAETEFINTAVLRVILRAKGVLAGGERQLTLRSPSPIAGRLLQIFGLGHLVAPTPEPTT
jgi:anti-anti-sigma factor